VAYTWKRHRIKHVVIDEGWVRHAGCPSVGFLKGSAEAEAALAGVTVMGEPRAVTLPAQCAIPPEVLAAAFANHTDDADDTSPRDADGEVIGWPEGAGAEEEAEEEEE